MDLTEVLSTLSEHEQHLMLRSVLHCTSAELPEWAQLHNHVTDLDAARLIHAIERGFTIVQEGAAWTDLRGTLRAKMPHLTRIVNECLRLRLVERRSHELAPDVWRVWLVAAPVHLETGWINRPACLNVPNRTMMRFRLTADPALIDCKACLALDR